MRRAIAIPAMSVLLLAGSATVANADELANVCGVLSLYKAPNSIVQGEIVVGGVRFFMEVRGETSGIPAGFAIGDNVCIRGTWEPIGRVLRQFTITHSSLPITSTGSRAWLGLVVTGVGLLLVVAARRRGAQWTN